jgi:hypothetical protein
MCAHSYYFVIQEIPQGAPDFLSDLRWETKETLISSAGLVSSCSTERLLCDFIEFGDRFSSEQVVDFGT